MKKLLLVIFASTLFTTVHPAAHTTDLPDFSAIACDESNLLDALPFPNTPDFFKPYFFLGTSIVDPTVPGGEEAVNYVLSQIYSWGITDFHLSPMEDRLVANDEQRRGDDLRRLLLNTFCKSLLSEDIKEKIQRQYPDYNDSYRCAHAIESRCFNFDRQLLQLNAIIASGEQRLWNSAIKEACQNVTAERKSELAHQMIQRRFPDATDEEVTALIARIVEFLDSDDDFTLLNPAERGNEFLRPFLKFYPGPKELHELVPQLFESTQEMLDEGQQHPLVAAAHLYVKFNNIHPYFYANQHMANILVNLLLMQHGLPPFPFNKNFKPYKIICKYQLDEAEDMIRDTQWCFYHHYTNKGALQDQAGLVQDKIEITERNRRARKRREAQQAQAMNCQQQ